MIRLKIAAMTTFLTLGPLVAEALARSSWSGAGS